jgi:hypothetical protein
MQRQLAASLPDVCRVQISGEGVQVSIRLGLSLIAALLLEARFFSEPAFVGCPESGNTLVVPLPKKVGVLSNCS